MKIAITKQLYEKVRAGYLWVFYDEIKAENLGDGQIVDLYYKDMFVAKAYYNSKSKISYRILSFENQKIDLNFWIKKLELLYKQKSLFYQNNFRWVYSEGDFLPGLIVDLYTSNQVKIAVCMFLTLGIEDQKQNIVEALKKLGVGCIINRSDSNLRTLEGLDLVRKIEYGKIELPFSITIDGITFLIDPLKGQKTGYYFDQTENRKFLKYICKGGVVLDVFSYIGSFSLYCLKYGARFTEMIDESSYVQNVVPQIMKLNNFQDKYILHIDNAFKKLREMNDLGKSFSVVIVDPPSFTKTKDKIQNALKAYFDVYYNALKLVSNEGYFVVSSCSQKVTQEQILQVIRNCFFRANVRGKMIYCGKQAPDHPINPSMPETEYLKFFVFQIYKDE
ncbi:MAG: class I SAM-dependent rRNA methyltransferase [bacterium]